MTVLDAKLHWTGTTGSRDRKSIEYTGVWLLWTDDKNDQTKTVLDWFEINRVARGYPYQYAGDAGSLAFADKISAKRTEGTEFAGTGIYHWEITVNYRTQSNDEEPGEDGQPKSNPVDRRPRITARTVQYTAPVRKAVFKGFVGFPPKVKFDIRYPVGSEIVPMNSAFFPLNPPMEKDESRYVIEITRNVLTYDASEDYLLANSINNKAFKLVKYGYTFNPIPKYTAKIRDITMHLRRETGFDYIEVSYALDINPDTWIHDEVDRGIHTTLFAAGGGVDADPDGRGGTVDQNTPIPEGIPKSRTLVDFEERPITEPVLFDGAGEPLDMSTIPAPDPIYLKWGKYRERNFLDEVLLQGIIEAI